MSPSEPTFDPRVLEVLARGHDLPSMPVVALEVLRVARDEHAGTGELAEVIALDPVLAARILKLANSPLFSGRVQITSLHRACSQLGFKTVKSMALSFALVDSLEGPLAKAFDPCEYQKRSVIRAVSAKLIAEEVLPVLADEAFLTGLLSRIGQLLLASCLPAEYETVLAHANDQWPSRELESKVLGFSSDELSAAFLHSWNLPPLIHQSIIYAPDPSKVSASLAKGIKELAQILNLTACCEELVCGCNGPEVLVNLRRSAFRFFSLKAETVEQMFSAVDHRAIEIAEILDIRIRGRLDVAALRREAQREVLRETMAMVQDVAVTRQRAAQLEQENSQLLEKAQTDPLTGLANRGAFQDALTSCLAGSAPQSIGLLMIDIDHFKSVNDTHGHPFGDELLQQVAATLQTLTRESDLAARYGGDEFAVLMRRTSVDGLKKVAERIRSTIEKQCMPTEAGDVSTTVSIGGAHTGIFDWPVAPERFVEAADWFLYRAKQQGRNQCDFSSEDTKIEHRTGVPAG